AFAYLIDIIFGAKFIIVPGSAERGIERFALVTIIACTLELVIAVFLLLRRGRLAAFTTISVYLLVISFLALMFGTFQA
ncbi:MAG TPA: hypothetical protein VFT12_05280, partial [Thermoanaerobaculia bacterium]|nr:hypothetical protein [Thermoanaerobaculia bacterium]